MSSRTVGFRSKSPGGWVEMMQQAGKRCECGCGSAGASSLASDVPSRWDSRAWGTGADDERRVGRGWRGEVVLGQCSRPRTPALVLAAMQILMPVRSRGSCRGHRGRPSVAVLHAYVAPIAFRLPEILSKVHRVAWLCCQPWRSALHGANRKVVKGHVHGLLQDTARFSRVKGKVRYLIVFQCCFIGPSSFVLGGQLDKAIP
nr:hypothetical protein CFP56_64897 [Quercus suber]